MQKPIHPWLLSIFPILHLYSENLGIVTDVPVAVAIAASLSVTTLLVMGLRQLTGCLSKASLIASLILFGFYSYGYLAIFLEQGSHASALVALPYAFFISICALILLLWRRPADGIALSAFTTSGANTAAIVLLLYPTFMIASYFVEVSMRNPGGWVEEGDVQVAKEKVQDGPDHPDIYYIIVDGYSSNAHLLRSYGYDNSRFTDALEKLGFFVAYDSKSNYGATLLSLASSLNMQYMPDKPLAAEVDDLVYLRMSIADNAVARDLLARGYTYIYMLSGYLLPSRIADFNYDFGSDGLIEFKYSDTKSDERYFDIDSIVTGGFYKEPFSRLLVQTTLLRLFSGALEPWVQSGRSYLWSNPKRFLATLEELRKIPERSAATFTFVHLMEPHAPVQLHRDGSLLEQRIQKPSPRQFFEELEFVNDRLIEALGSVIEKSSTPPIIILQADHGSNLGDVWTRNYRLKHFEIMHALHLPGARPSGVTRELSPINTFGILLNEYFGADYEVREVKHYDVPKGYKDPFRQIDVSREFR